MQWRNEYIEQSYVIKTFIKRLELQEIGNYIINMYLYVYKGYVIDQNKKKKDND